MRRLAAGIIISLCAFLSLVDLYSLKYCRSGAVASARRLVIIHGPGLLMWAWLSDIKRDYVIYYIVLDSCHRLGTLTSTYFFLELLNVLPSKRFDRFAKVLQPINVESCRSLRATVAKPQISSYMRRVC